jgi:hypothetical protein
VIRLKLAKPWERTKEFARIFYIQRFGRFDPPGAPYFDDETRQWFETNLRSAKQYLEFGAGGSTVMAAEMGIPTLSVEGDPFYARTVRRAIGSKGQVTFMTPWQGLTTGWSRPLFPSRAKARRYVSAPFKKLAGQFPDLVLVDGRYRIACALETARQAHLQNAVANLLVDDYEKRRQYRVLEAWLGTPRRIGRSALFQVGHAHVRKKDVSLFLGMVD